MKTRSVILFGFLACLALPRAAGAQNPQPAPPTETHPKVAPPNASQPPPEQIAPNAGIGSTRSGRTLSDKLAQQQGTLHPPAVDPGIAAPLPQRGQGTMPVIPPPGTPGGDQKMVPK